MDLTMLLAQRPQLAPLLQGFPPQLIECSIPILLKAGQVVVLRDDPVSYAYFILEGDLIVFNETADGKSATLLTMRGPATISDLEVLSGSPIYVANVSAATDCIALRCTIADFSALLHTDIDFLWMISTAVSKKNFKISHDQGHAAFRSSLEKTVFFLLHYCTLYPPSPAAPTVVRKTRQAISSEIILSPKTVDRCLFRLLDEDYLSLVKGKVHITQAQHQRMMDHWGQTG
ncbi:MAG: Crp/Fnr family transcriptional regulator [Pseudoflavonifractor sp.]